MVCFLSDNFGFFIKFRRASFFLNTVLIWNNELSMLFVHHQLTPQFRLVGELQDYKSDVQDNYDAIVLGFQYDF